MPADEFADQIDGAVPMRERLDLLITTYVHFSMPTDTCSSMTSLVNSLSICRVLYVLTSQRVPLDTMNSAVSIPETRYLGYLPRHNYPSIVRSHSLIVRVAINADA